MELVDMFDGRRKPLNKVVERYTHIEGEYSQGSHIWIMNSKNEFLIQKRSANKRVYPNLWSVTSGGTDSKETTLDTALREVEEELGIKLKEEELELMMSYKRKHDFVDVWLLRKDIDIKDITLQEEEVTDVKWISQSELENLIKEEKMPQSIQIYYEFLKNLIN